MENQLEKKMDNEMETGGNIGISVLRCRVKRLGARFRVNTPSPNPQGLGLRV